MKKDKVLNDIKSLIDEIDKCTSDLVVARGKRDMEGVSQAHWAMESLMVAAHQELTFLYDHIRVLYGLKDKADQVYFRANSLSADINSSEALRKAMNDYWHYVNYELNKEGGIQT